MNILERIQDDVDDYLRLCKRYGERPETSRDGSGGLSANPYGAHAKALEARAKADAGRGA